MRPVGEERDGLAQAEGVEGNSADGFGGEGFHAGDRWSVRSDRRIGPAHWNGHFSARCSQ